MSSVSIVVISQRRVVIIGSGNCEMKAGISK